MKLSLLICVMLASIGQLYACKCGYTRTVRESLDTRELVIHGTVIRKDTVLLSETFHEEDIKAIKGSLKGDERKSRILEMTHVVRIELETITMYKGKGSRNRFVIYTPLLSATCGYRFEVGKEYIVYASENNFLGDMFKDEDTKNHYKKDNTFWTNLCTRSAEYSKSEDDALRALTKG